MNNGKRVGGGYMPVSVKETVETSALEVQLVMEILLNTTPIGTRK
jgi:hypothetical protein